MSTTIQTPPGEALWLGHPRGLFVCFATELWERFSFYGMKFLLLLYLTKYHLFDDTAGLEVLGGYAALVYAMPVIGGLLADRYLGMRKAVVFGGILLALGHLGMAFEGEQARQEAGNIVRDDRALQVFYFSLALIVMGVGFLKPNISTIVGQLYAQDDPRRDPGFTIFYMGINIGAFSATLLCGYLGETYGWSYGFGAAGIGMVIGLITFLRGQKYLHGLAEPRDVQLLAQRSALGISREWTIYLGAVAGIGGVAFRQLMSFFNTRQKYMVVMAQNLYFHALADNRGVIMTLADRAADEDVKEEMLLYSVLAKETVRRDDLHAVDQAIEQYLQKSFGINVDFDLEDALERLLKDGVAKETVDGVIQRDQMIVDYAAQQGIPVVMTLSGGYSPNAWECQYKSLKNLIEKYGMASKPEQKK